jgi:hypothetical protein
MSYFQLRTSVVFIIFNRPDLSIKVFEEIRKARPSKLFIIADGPRENHPNDVEKCANVRAIVNNVDWECEVFKNYSTINLGCSLRCSTGISWVFEFVDEAIILEDDCLPNMSFFQFCQELLEHYREDERVMQISGDNFEFREDSRKYSYYFSMFSHPVSIWGWATWKRAWSKYDYHLMHWPEIREAGSLTAYFGDGRLSQFWTRIFDDVSNCKFTWDYQWQFCRWVHEGLCIIPSKNLISNIGWGNDATHTIIVDSKSIWDNIPSHEMQFPLNHPPYVLRDINADKNNFDMLWSSQPLLSRFIWQIKKYLRNLFFANKF